MPLKYLFTATFADGSVIEQTADDKSTIDPEKRSAFFDVLEKEKETKLTRFELNGDGHTYAVDLIDGHFEIDGVSFFMHAAPATQFRIVFWREHTHHARTTPTTIEEIAHTIAFKIGWQSDVDGKEHERVMRFD